jgi:hypothetical protein
MIGLIRMALTWGHHSDKYSSNSAAAGALCSVASHPSHLRAESSAFSPLPANAAEFYPKDFDTGEKGNSDIIKSAFPC